MAIITISRGSYSGGKMLAESLAQKLGYRCVDRDFLVQKAAAWGIPADELHTALETPPTFLGLTRHEAYVYLAVIQATLADDVKAGNVIYHGLAGHLLLKDAGNVLRVRLIAPMEFRISNVQEARQLSRNEAIAHIEKMDQGRRKWTRSLYGVNWEDPSLYDVVVNLDRLDIAQAGEVLCAMLQQSAFADSPGSRQAIADLALASRLKATLATNAATAQLEFEIVARDGALSLKGEVIRPEQADEVQRIARTLRGVSAIDMDEVALAFTRM